MMTTKRKLVLFLALISLFYCVSLIQSTYAKYMSSADASAELTIAKWNILINNQDVVNNSDFSTTIEPVLNGNTYVKEGVIAPTSDGYFEIELDAGETEVSFSYTITADFAEDNTVTDLAITGYEVDNTLYTYTSPYTGTILFDDTERTKTIRFYVEWVDGTGETMDNEADTIATTEGSAKVNVNVNVTQLRN